MAATNRLPGDVSQLPVGELTQEASLMDREQITANVVEEIDRLVEMEKLESTLMAEGIAKFANPQKALLAMVAKKRAAVG